MVKVLNIVVFVSVYVIYSLSVHFFCIRNGADRTGAWGTSEAPLLSLDHCVVDLIARLSRAHLANSDISQLNLH